MGRNVLIFAHLHVSCSDIRHEAGTLAWEAAGWGKGDLGRGAAGSDWRVTTGISHAKVAGPLWQVCRLLTHMHMSHARLGPTLLCPHPPRAKWQSIRVPPQSRLLS